jgi:CRISPR-associated protein Csm4
MDLHLRTVTIRLRSSIHLGEREGWLEDTSALPLADTLFSAFCNGYRLLYGGQALTQFLNMFSTENIPVRISSAFPEWDGFRYFPIPLNQTSAEKELKKICWVEQNGFERLLKGERLEDVITNSQASCLPLRFIDESDVKKPSMPWDIQEVPRIGLDRTHNDPGDSYFYFGQTWFRPGASFFFLADVGNDIHWEHFKAVWRVLADEGIGGDRSVGNGLYHEPSFGSLNLSVPDYADGCLLLSLFYPLQSEQDVFTNAYYEFIERKGYLYSPLAQGLRRQGVRLFKTGSVLSTPKPLAGMLVPVTPGIFSDHEVYRYGIAMTVPCFLTGGSNAGSALG